MEDDLRRINRQARHRLKVADDLMKIAARKSVRTVFGWTHPDCVTLKEAARMLKGEPEPVADDRAVGVLSDA